jgi:release factor glutamine methyltransferase
MSLSPASDLEAEVVLRLRAAGCVFAEEEARLLVGEAGSRDRLEEMVTQRVEGVPLEHILGWAEFCGMRLVVARGVFVPRRRTELLAREALAAARAVGTARGGQPGTVVVDMCCGTAAVGALVAGALEGVELHAVDIDAAAAACARQNVGARGEVHEGDLYDALPDRLRGRVHVIAANAPYVPTEAIATMPPDARDHEPRFALDGGDDGLDIQRRVVEGAADWLAPGGRLLVETSRLQAPGSAGLFAGHGFDARVVRDDEVDGTVVLGLRR